MPCSFTIDFEGSAEDLHLRAESAVRGRGGKLLGDGRAGTFKLPTMVGPIAGSYEVAGQSVRFEVKRRPMMITCSQIEAKLRDALS